MMIRSLAALIPALAVAGPAAAEVKSVTANGFEVASTATIAAPSDRVYGALGPLQAEGVDGALSWTLKPAGGGTGVTLSYVVGGYIRGGVEQWAPRVDRVLDEQLQRLKGYIEGKSATR